MKSAIILIFLMVSSLSCKKDNDLKGVGILKNLTGLDGCGWVIQYDSSGTTKRLEPTNLGDFGVTLSDGQTVSFSYKKTGSPSICMVGDVIKLTSLTAR